MFGWNFLINMFDCLISFNIVLILLGFFKFSVIDFLLCLKNEVFLLLFKLILVLGLVVLCLIKIILVLKLVSIILVVGYGFKLVNLIIFILFSGFILFFLCYNIN